MRATSLLVAVLVAVELHKFVRHRLAAGWPERQLPPVTNRQGCRRWMVSLRGGQGDPS